ncbi:hypothetical protein V8G69_11770 [Gaetbulibacter sp. M235]
MGFFYDEGDSKTYESIQDWHKEIEHLIVPSIVMVILGIVVFIYFKYFYF